MRASWYDLLDVAPGASEDEIKAAWKTAIADLDPTDRKFRVYNEAAAVLLDPQKRAAYDAERSAEADEGVDEEPAGAGPQPSGREPSSAADVREAKPAPQRGWVPGWLLVVAAALTAAVVGVTAWMWFQIPSDSQVQDDTRAAQASAERAVVPILSYDATDLKTSRAAAESYLTSGYRKEYDKLFAAIIEQNAPATKTVVSAELLESGVVRANDDRVQILVLVNQSRTNKRRPDPVVFKNYVTMTMEQVGGDWLVAGMKT